MIEHNLSAPGTKAGRTQRVVLDLLRRHAAEGGLPTNGRFVFYELEQEGNATKPSPDDLRPNRRRSRGWPPGSQDVTDALTHLREVGAIPWSWVVDEERSLDQWAHAPSVLEYLLDRLPEATVSPWNGTPPPLILCESNATAGVLRAHASEYVCPIAGTKGHAGGFLRTVVAPELRSGGRLRQVLYLGDLDRSGEHIEENSRRVLEDVLDDSLDWLRVAITEEQAADIDPIYKVDGRDRRGAFAWEVEALGQAAVVGLVRSHLDALLPEPLARVQEREQGERDALFVLLERHRNPA